MIVVVVIVVVVYCLLCVVVVVIWCWWLLVVLVIEANLPVPSTQKRQSTSTISNWQSLGEISGTSSMVRASVSWFPMNRSSNLGLKHRLLGMSLFKLLAQLA
jgi:hypothetical protein